MKTKQNKKNFKGLKKKVGIELINHELLCIFVKGTAEPVLDFELCAIKC